VPGDGYSTNLVPNTSAFGRLLTAKRSFGTSVIPRHRNKINRLLAEPEFWQILGGGAIDKLDFRDQDHSRPAAEGFRQA